jgi:acyl-CoA synthetase (AMP-forming)/AMP-acid ligase II
LQEAGSSLAIAFDGQEFDWEWLSRSAGTLDRLIAAAGLQDRTPTALLARNRPGQIATLASNLAARRATHMVHAAQAPAAIARELAELGVSMIVADEQDWHDDLIAVARSAGAAGVIIGWDHSLSLHPELPQAGPGPAADIDAELAFGILSSGTTGLPKRTPLSWSTIAAAAADAANAHVGSDKAGTAQIMLHPLGNIAGVSFLVPALAARQPVSLLEKFTVQGWADAVERYRPVRASLPAAALRMVLEAGVAPDRIASLKVVAVGGSRIEPDLRDAFEKRYAIPVLLAYGATEFAGVVASWSLDLYARCGAAKRESVGLPSCGVTLKIVEPESRTELPAGSIGIIAAQVARLGGQWLYTSDLGAIDEDGFLYLHGRVDGAINRGGFKIVPEVVERALRGCPGVRDAVVVGLADQRLGAVPAAMVEQDPAGPLLDQHGLLNQLRSQLAAYQIPVKLAVVAQLPRTGTLKIALGEVRRQLAELP